MFDDFEVESLLPLLGAADDGGQGRRQLTHRRGYTPVATSPNSDAGAPVAGGGRAHAASGCLPCTNCCVCVPQDRWFAVEKFGRFDSMLGPGFAFIGFDLCGCCVGFRSMTKRIVQNMCLVHTKTKDHVFVTVKVAVQQSVSPEYVWESMYTLADEQHQIESAVANVVRSKLPQMLLDDAFEHCQELSNTILVSLEREMASYGFQIHNALVVDLMPDRTVRESMNEVMKQKLHQEVVRAEADANRIRVVKAAEGRARATELEGEGSARQTRAIVTGLRETLMDAAGNELPTKAISELFLTTQYFETMRRVAASKHADVVFTLAGGVDAGDECLDSPEQLEMGAAAREESPLSRWLCK